MYTLEVHNLNKKIKNKQLLHNVDLCIQPGEIFGLLGPNGAGKTTFIRNITSIMKPDSGEIFICGKNLTKEHTDAISNIGALIENPSLYPNMSGYDNLKIFATLSNVDKNRIDEVIKLINLGNSISNKVKTYSLGMKQRLGIAVALLNQPKLLILDEPTNGLDPQGISDMRNYLKEISHNQGVSVLVSSHMLSEMNLMCDRFAIMKQGRIVKVISQNDPICKFDIETYCIDVVDIAKAFELLKNNNYNITVNNNQILISCKRENIPTILKLLISANIDVFGIKIEGNPLEKYYFNVVNSQTEGGM